MINALVKLCREGDLEKVKNFIADNPGIDIHMENETVFMVAVSEDNLELVKYFVEEHQVDINTCDDIAFILSVFHKCPDMMKYLLEECGADIHAQDESALGVSITNKYFDVAKYLIKNGADQSIFKNCSKKDYDFCESVMQELAKEKAIEKSLRAQKEDNKFKRNIQALKKEAAKKRPIRRNTKTIAKFKNGGR